MIRKGSYIFFVFLVLSGCNQQNDYQVTPPETVVNGSVVKYNETNLKSGNIPDHRLVESSVKGNKVKKKPAAIYSSNGSSPETIFRMDSVTIRKLRQLHQSDIELDLSEPVSQDYLFLPYDSLRMERYITLNREVLLKINFDNDILNNTDRFYTNGIRIEIISPALRVFPLNFSMLPYWGSGTNYYGIAVVQNMYTPSTTKVGGILYGDRPYAAYLYLGNYKITLDPEKKFSQTSELDLGIIGPYSFGGFIQKAFHTSVPTNVEPLGWVYQVQNDLVLNYNLCFEKGFISNRNFELNIYTNPSLGTLYTNIKGGIRLRGGIMNPYFINLGISKARYNRQLGLKNTQLFLSVNLEGKVIGYDATLQGGLFNQSSVYKINGASISRFAFEGNVGLTLTHGGLRLEVGQYLLSPEFHNGWWHHWVHTGLTFSL